jgi:hypothetical protein
VELLATGRNPRHPDRTFELKHDCFRGVTSHGECNLVSRRKNVYKSFKPLQTEIGRARDLRDALPFLCLYVGANFLSPSRIVLSRDGFKTVLRYRLGDLNHPSQNRLPVLSVDNDEGRSETIGLKELANDSRELFGFFKVHEMAGIGNHNPSRVSDTGLDYSSVRVNVRNVGLTD